MKFLDTLNVEVREDLLQQESVLTILSYVKPKEYASLCAEYKQFVANVSDSYSFGNFLLDVVVADRIFEQRELALLGGVKYVSEYLLSRSSESINF